MHIQLTPNKKAGILVETCPPSSGSVEASMPSHPSSLPGPLVVPVAPGLVVLLLIGGLHGAHRPLSHQTNTSLQASSSAFRPSVYRI